MKNTCKLCKLDLDEELFSWNASRNKRRTTCQVCYLDYQRQYREKNKERLLSNQRERRAAERVRKPSGRTLLGEYLRANPCVDCGETDPVVLEFDHRDPTLKNFAISTRRKRSWEVLFSEIQQCDVVCANCHKRRTAKANNWWKLNI